MSVPTAPRAARAVELRLRGLRKAYGRTPAVREVTLDVPAGTITSLIGPSGCGKTTTLRMVAGLEQADAGTIHAGDRLLTDGATGTPPEKRDMGMVFQSYALWPHMTVAENVAYGLKRRGHPSANVAEKVASVLAIVGMAGFTERLPGQLSGGQQQRVALARSIATEPSILLFDEPLSNLDAVLREQMRFEIRSLQQRIGITAVYVTHSQDEALVLSDQVAVMRDGAIEQRGAPLDVYNVPRTEFVATFIGLANILEVEGLEVSGAGAAGRYRGAARLVAGAGTPDAMRARGGASKLCVRPVDIRIAREGEVSSEAGEFNRLAGTVTAVLFTGGLVEYFVAPDGAGDAIVRVQGTPPMAVNQGDRVVLAFAPARTVALES